MARDWQAFDAELRARVPEIAIELLGPPQLKAGREWRWGRKGSLSLVVAGERAGVWFDHEAGEGGGFVDFIARSSGLSRSAARDWTADRIGISDIPAPRPRPRKKIGLASAPAPEPPAVNVPPSAPEEIPHDPAAAARRRAALIWDAAGPAPVDHPYLQRKQVGPNGLRCDGRGHLVVPLRDLDGTLHTVETISPEGQKRYLAGGAKRGHFCIIGREPDGPEPILICEGWATGASLHEATGHTVIAAMDAGNLAPVAELVRARHPAADVVIVADNDAKPGRDSNPGVEAATKAAVATEARLAVPTMPGDANDLAVAQGRDAVAALVAGAAPVPPPEPTYAEPRLLPEAARAELTAAIAAFVEAVPVYWQAVEAAEAAPEPANADPLDFNALGPTLVPPLLGLPVDVGLGKTSTARAAIAGLIASGGLGGRKVVFAVPRHDLGQEQVDAFRALGVRVMLWKGRTAPDPTPENAEQLMCLDPEATFDALEVEHPVEQSCCKVRRSGETHICARYHSCGYQRQKPEAQAAQVIVCAHDSLFHMKPEVIGAVGLLVIDEAFWQSGLRGLDGKAVLTQDGLEPGRSSLTCYGAKGRMDEQATADLVAARGRLWKALQVSEPGPLRLGLLQAVGLTAEDCRNAASLERRRMRDAGLLPGMSAVERRKRIEKVLPPHGQPWAPPGRCATMWLILAEALENEHDPAGAELAHERTENGSVRALKLRWRGRLRGGWVADVPILHLDATMRGELVRPYLPSLAIGVPVAARLPHVRIRQVLDSPTTAKALTPPAQAPERDRRAAVNHLRDLRSWIALRALECHRPDARIDLLVVGQKAAVDALRAAGLPPRVETVHFNALSGLDRWGDVGGMIVMGRTLPAPATVELLAAALTGRSPKANPQEGGWWYPSAEHRIRLQGCVSAPVAGVVHPDPTAEAIRWTICEGELIQAIGRGRGVNRTAGSTLDIDLLTDVVLPVTVHELVRWPDLRPSRRDLMAMSGVLLENAADMAACFPDLWPSAEAARQDRSRSVTNGYYRNLYNSQMSHSSAEVTYRPAGPGHRARTARVDLARIPDPEAWLTNRLGPLARCDIAAPLGEQAVHRAGLEALASRLSASMRAVLATHQATLNALAARLETAKPAAPQRSHHPKPKEETEA
jgi:putative DNA primase/helicase